MTTVQQANGNLIVGIWRSFRSLPGWVQIWVAFILMPINMASLFFVGEPSGIWIAFLANIAMMLNLPVMLADRGFSKMMALPHLIPWTILVLWLAVAPPEAAGTYRTYLTVLLVADTISLLFDYPDALRWLRGERQIASSLRA